MKLSESEFIEHVIRTYHQQYLDFPVLNEGTGRWTEFGYPDFHIATFEKLVHFYMTVSTSSSCNLHFLPKAICFLKYSAEEPDTVDVLDVNSLCISSGWSNESVISFSYHTYRLLKTEEEYFQYSTVDEHILSLESSKMIDDIINHHYNKTITVESVHDFIFRNGTYHDHKRG